jgi:acyl-coenzyme A thioesterase PaaI-like protein
VSAAAYEFDVDTAVEAVADHRFAAAITDRWNVLGGRPNGGYVMGVCLQALTRVMPAPDPLVVSAFFLRPVRPGPADVRTAILRSGRRIATGEATLYQDGKESLRVTAAFSDLRQAGRTVVLAAPPELPPPDRAMDLMGGRAIPELSIAQRVVSRGGVARLGAGQAERPADPGVLDAVSGRARAGSAEPGLAGGRGRAARARARRDGLRDGRADRAPARQSRQLALLP